MHNVDVCQRFGIRKQPVWARNDFEAHLRLARELTTALAAISCYLNIKSLIDETDLTFDEMHFQSLNAKAKMSYYFAFALRLQQCYIRVLDVMEPFCRVQFTTRPEGGFSIRLVIENREYNCNYLNDHICGLAWVIGKINFHIHTYVQESR